MNLRHVVFDFDGTCTDIPAADRAFLEEYRRLLSLEVAPCSASEWEHALELVRSRSPQEGWMLGGTPAAPVAADPTRTPRGRSSRTLDGLLAHLDDL